MPSDVSEALEQIKVQDDAHQWYGRGKPVHLVVFGTAKGNIIAWERQAPSD